MTLHVMAPFYHCLISFFLISFNLFSIFIFVLVPYLYTNTAPPPHNNFVDHFWHHQIHRMDVFTRLIDVDTVRVPN